MSTEQKSLTPEAAQIANTNTQIKEDNMTAANTNPTAIEAQNANDFIKEEAMTSAVSTQATTEAPNTNPQIIDVPMDKLAVATSLPRRNSGDLETLQKSIRKNGLLEFLTVCKSNEDDFYMVLDGTRRLTALIEFGWKSVPCIVLDTTMSLGEMAHYAYEKNMERKSLSPLEIALHLKSMQEKYGYSLRDLDALGYGSPAKISQLIRLLDLPAKVKDMIENAELTTSHGIVLGKLSNAKQQEKMAKRAVDFGWSAKRLEVSIDSFLKKGKAPKEKVIIPEGEIPGVYFKDAKDMSELPDKSVHLIVTSPPYCVGMEFEKGISYADHWENMQEVMAESARVLVPGGIMALNVGDIHNYKGPEGKNEQSQIQLVGHKYQSFLRRHKVYLSDIIIWVKGTHAHSKDVSKVMTDRTPHTGYRILISYDPVYIFRKAGDREVPSEQAAADSILTREEWSRWASGIWTIDRVRKMEGHPAMYPDELAYRLIKMFSYEGETVLDPFLGSGTTMKVARQLGREAFGYEREVQYKQVIMDKLGVGEDGVITQSMIGFAKEMMTREDVEELVKQAEAEAAEKMFADEAEVAETVTAE